MTSRAHSSDAGVRCVRPRGLVVTRLDRLARSTRDLLNVFGSGEAGRRRFPLAQGCMVRHHHASWGADVDGPRRPRRAKAGSEPRGAVCGWFKPLWATRPQDAPTDSLCAARRPFDGGPLATPAPPPRGAKWATKQVCHYRTTVTAIARRAGMMLRCGK
jgi:hypothetical protein